MPFSLCLDMVEVNNIISLKCCNDDTGHSVYCTTCLVALGAACIYYVRSGCKSGLMMSTADAEAVDEETHVLERSRLQKYKAFICVLVFFER